MITAPTPTAAPRMTAAEALEKAATLIEERGLAKGEMADGRGRLCMLGAINFAVAGDAYAGAFNGAFNLGSRTRTIRDAQRCLFYQLPETDTTITFNDRPSTTKKEAVALLRKAAKECAS